jgi:hypothetical protein
VSLWFWHAEIIWGLKYLLSVPPNDLVALLSCLQDMIALPSWSEQDFSVFTACSTIFMKTDVNGEGQASFKCDLGRSTASS